MPEETSTLTRMCWLFPDRESTRTGAKWAAAFWDTYVEVAKEVDLSWDRVAPEAVTVDALDPRRPKVYVDGKLVTPQDTLFVTSLYSLPYQAADVFNQFSLYAVLEQAGFYLPHPQPGRRLQRQAGHHPVPEGLSHPADPHRADRLGPRPGVRRVRGGDRGPDWNGR